MKRTNKILAIVLSVVLLFSAFPFGNFTATAETSGTTGDCTWSLDGTVLTISGNGAMANYPYKSSPWGKSISEVVIEKGVTSIGERAFNRCTSLTSITIPNSVTSIGREAFYYCSKLTSITIPDGVTSIGGTAFVGCSSLASITIPDSITSIGIFAFSDTGYYNTSSNWENNVLYIGNHLIEAKDSISGDYIIKNRTKSIADEAFKNCSSLTSITMPDGVTSIGCAVFQKCSSLTSITIPDSVTSIRSAAFSDTEYYNNAKNWGNDVLYIGNHLIKAKDSISGDYIIKSGTKSIAEEAFRNCSSLTSITIPDSVTSIEYWAFYGCSSLKNIYYCGTKKEWNSISIADYNERLTSATICFLSEHEHIFGAWQVITDTTCTSDGKEYRICSSCSKEEIRVLSATGHKYNSVITFATCTDQGYTTYTCLNCNDIYLDDYTESLGHDFDTEFTIDKPVTETENGSKSRHCTRCDEVTDVTVIPRKITLYRYKDREKIYTSSQTKLNIPWILYATETQYKHINFNSVIKPSDYFGMDSSYCIHDKILVYRYVNNYNSGQWFYATPSEFINKDASIVLSYSSDGKSYYQYIYCTSKTPYAVYYYYSWSEWSEWSTWSKTKRTESDSVKVEKIQTYDESLDSENLVTLMQSVVNQDNDITHDYNADEKVNLLDIVRLKKFLASI